MKLKDTVHRNLVRNLLIFLLFVFLFGYSANLANVNFLNLFSNNRQAGAFIAQFLQPDWAFLPAIVNPLIQTIQMAVVGTVIGSLFAIPFSFLATTIVTRNVVITTICRFILSIIRTIPNLLLAALVVAFVGIGQVTGVITLSIFTFGVLSKLMYDLIETIDLSPIESAESVGANRTQIAFWTIVPQISHQIASYILYVFEINIRASTILGYVGAGGIGIVLNSSLGLFRYDRVAVIILVILVVILVIDFLGEYFRRKLS